MLFYAFGLQGALLEVLVAGPDVFDEVGVACSTPQTLIAAFAHPLVRDRRMRREVVERSLFRRELWGHFALTWIFDAFGRDENALRFNCANGSVM